MIRLATYLLLLGLVAGGVYWLSKRDSDRPASPAATVPSRPVTDKRQLPQYDGEMTRAMTHYALGDLRSALGLLEKSSSSPGAARARDLFYLGKTHLGLGDRERARQTWLELIRSEPASTYCGDAFFELACMVGEKSPKGLALLEKALWGHPQSVGARRAASILGDHYWERSAAEKAYRAYSLALDDHLSASGAAMIRKRLAQLNERLLLSPRPFPSGTIYHEVRRGEVLWHIARRYRISPGFIRMMNRMSSNRIYPGERLKILQGSFRILVFKSTYTLRLYFNDLFVKEYRVGLGKDDRTPVGRFVIAAKLEKPPWYFRGKLYPFGHPENVLGTRWLGFRNRPGVSGYGIHGTKDPSSIGKNLSNGCVRMRNPEVEELFALVPRGTQVEIKV